MTPAAVARVVVVDDHSLFRAGVIAELADRVVVVGEAGDVEAAVEVVNRLQPDLVLLDVHLPGGGGSAVVGRIDTTVSRVLGLSVSDSPEDVIRLVRAGARGYVTKAISTADLVEAVQRVAAGDAFFSPRLAGFVLDAFGSAVAEAPNGGAGEAPPADDGWNGLTAREREVMRLLARGYSYKEIGVRLHISVKTVESHASAVLRKLQVSSRYELTRWAVDRDVL